jgi:hypothetical protein
MTYSRYSPDRVTITWKGNLITGFAEGTFVEVERDEDAFTKYVGSDGAVTRTRNLNRSGKITVTLMATAAINDQLWADAIFDESFGNEEGPIEIADLSGAMYCSATYAWVMKMPKVERAKESGTVVWVFDCAELAINPSGNATLNP